jgi:phage baseplate assembly protein W
MADSPAEKAFLGVGWAFPLQIDPEGEIAMASFEDDIRQAIRIIIGTALGERVMRPDFGGGLKRLVFEPVNTTTMALVKHQVEQALIDWEPRIDLDDIRVTTDPATRNLLLIEVDYRVRATNTFYNLVYPFYLIEGERT